MKKLFFSILILTLIPFIYASSETNHVTDWNRPETIDPMKANVGDFLDTDLEKIYVKASRAYNEKNYTEAARQYLLYLRHDITNPTAIYNLACCYGLLGDDVLAAKYLDRSVNAGFTDLKHIQNDPDFNTVRSTENFKKIMHIITDKIAKEVHHDFDTIVFNSIHLSKCFVKLPENYNASRKYSLLFALHGFGSNAEDFMSLASAVDKKDIIFAAIHAPYPHPAIPDGYSWEMFDVNDEQTKDMLASVEKRVLDAVKKLKSEYPIDTTYLMGFSQGAMTTLRTGLNHPGHFAGLIAFGGWIDTKQPINLNRAGKSAPSICIVHGKKDNSIKYEEALNAEKILNANQYRLKLLTFDGGHEVPAEMLKQAMEWIAGKK